LLPASEVKSLEFSGGRFAAGYGEFLARYLIGRVDLDEVEAELRAQAARLRQLGVTLVHANGHQHLHVLPGVFDRLLRVASEFGIRYVRIPDDRAPGAFGLRSAAVAALGRLARRAAPAARDRGFVTNDRTIGIRDAGHLDSVLLARLLDHAAGVTELVTHPGSGAGLRERYAWGYDWQGEADALCDRALRAECARRGIEIVPVRALIGAPPD
jgi:predicted glycoside hydrolase/deacetylase ChbG (UPF0249 family)